MESVLGSRCGLQHRLPKCFELAKNVFAPSQTCFGSDFKVFFHDDSISFTPEYARNQKIFFAEVSKLSDSRNGPQALRERSGAGDGVVRGGAPHKTKFIFVEA